MLLDTNITVVVQAVDTGIVNSKRKAPLTGKTGIPRSIRARVAHFAKAQQHSKKRESSPQSPNQEAAISRSGHVALGPWAGPFADATTTTSSTPVYIDSMGIMYESLLHTRSGITVPAADAPAAKALLMTGKAAEAGRWDDTAAARAAEHRRASGIQKPSAKWAAKRGSRSRRMNTVMQPRRMN